MKRMILYLVVFLITLHFSAAQPQSLLNKPLTKENFKLFDQYIRKYAPSDSALNVVINIARQHYNNNRAMVARELYKSYVQLFPQKKEVIEKEISNLLQVALTQSPTRDFVYLYDRYAREAAPSEDAFIAVQRVSENYILRKEWDSAAAVYRHFKPLFPEKANFFKEIIAILDAPKEGLKVSNIGKPVNTKNDEWDPNTSPDCKTLYFSVTSPDTLEYSRICSSEFINGAWTQPKNISGEVSGSAYKKLDNVSADGNTILLSAEFEGTFGKSDIYTLSRDSRGWGGVKHLPMPVNSKYQDESANFTADGKAIIFASDRPGGIGPKVEFGTYKHGTTLGNMDIYVAILTDSGWSEPVNLGSKINTPYTERSAYLHPDGKTLYFSSDGHPGIGRLDIYKSERLRDDSWTEWSQPVNLGKEINTPFDDGEFKVTADGDSAFFAEANRAGGIGGWDIYTTTMPKKGKPGKVAILTGSVMDSKGRPLETKFDWEEIRKDLKPEHQGIATAIGSYLIPLPLSKKYSIYASSSGYYPATFTYDLSGESEQKNIIRDIILVSDEEIRKGSPIKLTGIVFNQSTNEISKESGPELTRLAEYLGKFPECIYEIQLSTGLNTDSKELFLARTKAVADYLIGKGIRPEKIKLNTLEATNQADVIRIEILSR